MNTPFGNFSDLICFFSVLAVFAVAIIVGSIGHAQNSEFMSFTAVDSKGRRPFRMEDRLLLLFRHSSIVACDGKCRFEVRQFDASPIG